MPIVIRFDKAQGILRTTVEGNPEPNELFDVLTAITKSEEYPPDIRTIWDLRELSFRTYDSESVRVVSNIYKQFPARTSAKIAYVVADQLGFGMVRMFQHLTEANAPLSGVFYDYVEAERWIMRTDNGKDRP